MIMDEKHVEKGLNLYRLLHGSIQALIHDISFSQESVSDALEDYPVTGTTAGSKKYGMSLNHLLNFKYAPREKPLAYLPRNGRKKYTPFNKEQFIQAK